MLKASEEPLHEHTTVSILAFITRITSTKSKIAFSNKCYKELLRLFSDILPSNHKMLKDMYQSKKLLSALGMEYEKIDVCKDNCNIRLMSAKINCYLLSVCVQRQLLIRLILSTVVLSLTSISIISTRINMANRWCDTMGRGSTGER
jgi:hypothetical protein